MLNKPLNTQHYSKVVNVTLHSSSSAEIVDTMDAMAGLFYYLQFSINFENSVILIFRILIYSYQFNKLCELQRPHLKFGIVSSLGGIGPENRLFSTFLYDKQ